MRVCDKIRAAIRQNAQLKNRPAPEGRVLVLLVMTVTQQLAVLHALNSY
ncbi:hypothetical protein [Saccharophagus sp. K07]|jgi:hypothetical protein|nr:hypothetical protein [Saccharophagus sp. K07]